ncbi:pyroglutamyl-peptidase I family protein, partial [Staphylococcus capitis]
MIQFHTHTFSFKILVTPFHPFHPQSTNPPLQPLHPLHTHIPEHLITKLQIPTLFHESKN